MNTTTIRPLELLLDDCRGIYIPRDFCQFENLADWGLADNDNVDICLAGPDHEYYWEAWQAILDNAKHTIYGHSLYQDGSLWAINYDTISNEQYKEFFGEDRE